MIRYTKVGELPTSVRNILGAWTESEDEDLLQTLFGGVVILLETEEELRSAIKKLFADPFLHEEELDFIDIYVLQDSHLILSVITNNDGGDTYIVLPETLEYSSELEALLLSKQEFFTEEKLNFEENPTFWKK